MGRRVTDLPRRTLTPRSLRSMSCAPWLIGRLCFWADPHALRVVFEDVFGFPRGTVLRGTSPGTRFIVTGEETERGQLAVEMRPFWEAS